MPPLSIAEIKALLILVVSDKRKSLVEKGEMFLGSNCSDEVFCVGIVAFASTIRRNPNRTAVNSQQHERITVRLKKYFKIILGALPIFITFISYLLSHYVSVSNFILKHFFNPFFVD